VGDLSRLVEAAGETMFFSSVPPPPKPVGVGAVWIAGSRQPIGGIDTVVYRLYRVKSIDAQKAVLALESHDYATSGELNAPGLPPGAKLAQFDSQAVGELEVTLDDSLAQRSKITQQLQMVLREGDGPSARSLQAQMVTEGTLTRSAK
jgi:hypothetical protein